MVTCEGIPAIIHVPVASLRTDKASEDISFLPLDGNALDIGLIGDALIVSTDNIHQPGSTSEIDSSEVNSSTIIHDIAETPNQHNRTSNHDFKLSRQ